MHSWTVRLYLLPSHLPATDWASTYIIMCCLDLPSVCFGSLRERERRLVCICIEPYGDWNSDWIGVFFFSPHSSSSSCAWLVYDKSVALTPRVGREQECLWSDKLHIRALFNILYMATSDELLRCQIEEQQHRMQKCWKCMRSIGKRKEVKSFGELESSTLQEE